MERFLKRRNSSPPSHHPPAKRKITRENMDLDLIQLYDWTTASRLYKQLEKEIDYNTPQQSRIHVFGKWHDIPRKQAAYGDEGLSYKFSGITVYPKSWTPVLTEIKKKVEHQLGINFNFVLVNRYENGQQHIGEHKDDEKDLLPDSPIASVTFGQEREFVFRHEDLHFKRRRSDEIPPVKLMLKHGSLLVMNSPTNKFWYHSLPVRRAVTQTRVNLTFRQMRIAKVD
ncbi:DNA oxidative demethylase ALKBH2-like [Corticium candelabrum]|uniref:DNA oxidative demethylase ALKBH2-like n=1 Tax=Corticium candelabrum TaxID=121492 RepID=UPI002E2615C2|nr:DNA oxidative demethylase ALKBH2-like [Corticium candelabrum]